MTKLIIKTKGGPSSGNYAPEHHGRPGLVGGSRTVGGNINIANANDVQQARSERGYDAKVSDLQEDGIDNLLSKKFPDYPEAIKDDVCKTLADKAGVSYKEANQFIKQWAISSNAKSASLSIQEAISEELGLQLSDYQKAQLSGKANKSKLDRETERKLVRAMYDNTQEYLKAHGYQDGDTVMLYRGIRAKIDAKPGDIIDSSKSKLGNSAESWTSDKSTAYNFASNFAGTMGKTTGLGLVLMTKVPIANILSLSRTGFGCYDEGEFVIAGNIPGSTVGVLDTSR